MKNHPLLTSCAALLRTAAFLSVVMAAGTAVAQTWSSRDVGTVGFAGSSTDDRGWITLRGSGADIWNSADGCHFLALPQSGDVTLAVRVLDVGGNNAWAKVGLMMRQDFTPGSPAVMAYATPGNHVGLQARAAAGAATTAVADGMTPVPTWLMLDRAGNVFRAYRSADGDNWTKIGEVNLTMTGSIQVGLAVSSHNNAGLQIATLTDFTLVTPPASPPPPPTVEVQGSTIMGWSGGDIGAVGATGTTTSDGSSFTVRAGGGDMWGAADALRMQYRRYVGDGMVAARVVSLTNTDAWAKAGVMVRGTFDSTSPNAAMVITPGGTCGFQARSTPGGATTFTTGPRVAVGHWVGVTRAGTQFKGWVSPDGINWTQVGTAAVTMPDDVFFGVVASAHSNTGAQTTATFDHVSSPDDSLPPP